jgi:hypothetical protein
VKDLTRVYAKSSRGYLEDGGRRFARIGFTGDDDGLEEAVEI